MAAASDLLRAIRWPQEDNKIPREIFTDPDLFRLEMDAVFTVVLDHPVLQAVFVYPL